MMINNELEYMWGGDSSVGIVTRLLPRLQWNRDWIPDRTREFLPTMSARPAMGSNGWRRLFLRSKMAGA
jgi:hypothetical protein